MNDLSQSIQIPITYTSTSIHRDNKVDRIIDERVRANRALKRRLSHSNGGVDIHQHTPKARVMIHHIHVTNKTMKTFGPRGKEYKKK